MACVCMYRFTRRIREKRENVSLFSRLSLLHTFFSPYHPWFPHHGSLFFLHSLFLSLSLSLLPPLSARKTLLVFSDDRQVRNVYTSCLFFLVPIFIVDLVIDVFCRCSLFPLFFYWYNRFSFYWTMHVRSHSWLRIVIVIFYTHTIGKTLFSIDAVLRAWCRYSYAFSFFFKL